MEKLTIRKLEKKDAAEICKINAEGLGGTDDLSLVQEKIDKLDKQIMEIIASNARIPFKDVAAVCGVSRAAIHQRVQRLIDTNVIVGSAPHSV
ncbi:MAG: AsnC family protein, partial [Treponema sp.]|nr:AsnC family protein [Treponema sp.]